MLPLMACHLGSWLNTSSPQQPRKSQYMISGITRPPHMAYPIAVPMMAASAIGALNRRWYGSASVRPR